LLVLLSFSVFANYPKYLIITRKAPPVNKPYQNSLKPLRVNRTPEKV